MEVEFPLSIEKFGGVVLRVRRVSAAEFCCGVHVRSGVWISIPALHVVVQRRGQERRGRMKWERRGTKACAR